MILVEADLAASLQSSQPLVIGGALDHVRGCSYDLTIGTIFWEGKIHNADDESVIVAPGGVVSILTKEELHLPDDICATAFAINKMSSQGFLVLNPGHIDPGFKGALTIKALNVRKVPMPLRVGRSIFTVIFQRLDKPTSSYPLNLQSRPAQEDQFYEMIVQTAPRTIFDMMEADRDGPYPGRAEVRSMIMRHWTTWLTAGSSVLILIFAAVAAYKSVYPTRLSDSSELRHNPENFSEKRVSAQQVLPSVGARSRGDSNQVSTPPALAVAPKEALPREEAGTPVPAERK